MSLAELAPNDLSTIIGKNQKRLRVKQGFSLEKLAALSGVSKSMLGQIEQGKSTPTINLLWKIAQALEVPFAALYSSGHEDDVVVLPSSKAKILYSQDGLFSSRALFPAKDEAQKIEFYELELKPRGQETAEAHAPGTFENLVVAEGEVEVVIDHKAYNLSKKDAINFKADVPHSYRNTSHQNKAIIYLVMIYAN